MSTYILTTYDAEQLAMDDMLNEDVQERALNDRELDEMYAEMLNEHFGDVSVAGKTYSTARVLKEIDPIVYRTGCSNWLDELIQKGEFVEVEIASR